MNTINSVAKYGGRKRENMILNVINHRKVFIIVDVFEDLGCELKPMFSQLNKFDFSVNSVFDYTSQK